jgi:DNA-directed RNA polymerase
MGELAEIDKARAVNAVAPNFVHACDAAHLLRTVNAAVSKGITSIATVHDSFGCLPPRAARFLKIIREELARMYEEHDVLREVLDQARADLDGRNH